MTVTVESGATVDDAGVVTGAEVVQSSHGAPGVVVVVWLIGLTGEVEVATVVVVVVQSSQGAVAKLELVVLSLIGPTAEDEVVEKEEVQAQVDGVEVEPPIGPT